jgi:predicted ATPase
VRLLTLTGPPGVGKTRPALEAGREVAPHFAHGVAVADLSPVRDPSLVFEALAQSLGANEGPANESLPERLGAALHDRAMLIILDNVEQVLPAASHLAELLVAAPRVTLLVTSREALHLRFEQIFHVAPLALPDPQHLPPLEELSQIPSVALFLQRARAITPDFALTEDNARAVAELCVHLDGLPLAIELAAARTLLLSPQMMLERLEQRLSLLRWQAQDLPERQQTLRSALAWSYDLLSPEEQALFRRLGIFVGGFTLDAAEAIAQEAPCETVDVLEGVSSLVDKSLVQSEQDGAGGHRFRLLESVREYALEQVTSCDEGEAVARAHARYFLELAEDADTPSRRSAASAPGEGPL